MISITRATSSQQGDASYLDPGAPAPEVMA